LKPAVPLYDPRYVYINAASHADDSTAFRARQEARRIAAQAKPATNVKQMKRSAK